MTPPPNHNHPCDSHACDHCYLCDVVGICCMTVSSGQRAQLEAEHRTGSSDWLHAAILADAQHVPAFADLVRLDALSRTIALPASISLGLLAAPSPDPLHHDAREEDIVVVAIPSRTSR
jgi:hypothetical protein